MLRLSSHSAGALALLFFFCLFIYCNCTSGPPASVPATDNGLVNKTWQLKTFTMKEVVGMVYRNKNQIKKDADAYLAGGVSWYFHENGKFKIREGETVSEGVWTADSKSKSLVCNIVTGEKERQLVFTDVYLTDVTFSAELKSFNVTYRVDAVSAGN